LAGGVDVGVAEKALDGDDVASRLKQPGGVCVSKFVEGGVFDVCLLGNVFESPEKMVF
jgi:hypothetical protein